MMTMHDVSGISATSRRQWEFHSRLEWLQDGIWRSHWRILARSV